LENPLKENAIYSDNLKQKNALASSRPIPDEVPTTMTFLLPSTDFKVINWSVLFDFSFSHS
jgi:hypothetical protein